MSRENCNFLLKYKDYNIIEKSNSVVLWQNINSQMSLTVRESGSFKNERDILVELMCRNFDEYHHIVKFHGSFAGTRKLAFETLDIDLKEYVSKNMDTLSLDDIRHIIQQMATALMAMKSIGVIHGSVCLGNIILEDQKTRPLRVKLANFSSAQLRSENKKGPELKEDELMLNAPEIYSDLPVSEASDMWSLGCAMFFMLSTSECHTHFYEWMKHCKKSCEDVEMEECVQLLQAMLNANPDERITPTGVLAHPFIVRGSYPWTSQCPPVITNGSCIDFLKFEIMQKLGSGGFGEMRKCRNSETGEVVAVKRPLGQYCAEREILILDALIAANADQHNIVKCHGWLDFTVGKAPVFELLDTDLDVIFRGSKKPMLLSDIRVIIQQMAEALLKLKLMGIVHADIKTNNIMLVDQQRPYRIKLIDFGLARYRSELKPGMGVQVRYYRAPEVFFGLPLSEAIDMWSLGCVMTWMLLGKRLFSGKSDKAVVGDVVKYLGMPADHVLDSGIHAKNFFTKSSLNMWTHKEIEQTRTSFCLPTGQELNCLDDLKTMQLENNNEAEAVEREQCTELLKAMLEMDPDRRITPQGVLEHPFINGQEPASCSKTANPNPEHCSPPPTDLPPLVQPATPERRFTTTDEYRPDSLEMVSDKMPKVPEDIEKASIPEDPIKCEVKGKQMEKKKMERFLDFFSWTKNIFLSPKVT